MGIEHQPGPNDRGPISRPDYIPKDLHNVYACQHMPCYTGTSNVDTAHSQGRNTRIDRPRTIRPPPMYVPRSTAKQNHTHAHMNTAPTYEGYATHYAVEGLQDDAGNDNTVSTPHSTCQKILHVHAYNKAVRKLRSKGLLDNWLGGTRTTAAGADTRNHGTNYDAQTGRQQIPDNHYIGPRKSA